MKKIILTLALLMICNTAQARDIKWINCIPYKEYKKEIKLEKIETTSADFEKINIEKNSYNFKYICKKMGIPQEYFITNNTGEDLILTGIYGNKKYFNRDLERKTSKRLKPMFKACFTTWYFYLPYVGIIPAAMSDVEKNKFIKDFPKNITIKEGEKIRILCIEMEKDSRLQFVFENKKVEF